MLLCFPYTGVLSYLLISRINQWGCKRFYQQESLNCQPDCSLLYCVVVVIYLCC